MQRSISRESNKEIRLKGKAGGEKIRSIKARVSLILCE
jgi:hypothetical protein